MKYLMLLFLLISISSCSTTKRTKRLTLFKDYNTVNTSFVVESDTIFIYELRFFKPQSALDCMKLIYENYGEWDEETKGKYQENINQFVWKNVKLFDDEETFTVIADGMETHKNYFASLMVFDSNNKDCFDPPHRLSEKLVYLFVSKMSNLNSNTSIYNKFR